MCPFHLTCLICWQKLFVIFPYNFFSSLGSSVMTLLSFKILIICAISFLSLKDYQLCWFFSMNQLLSSLIFLFAFLFCFYLISNLSYIISSLFKIFNTWRICMSSLHRGHDNLLFIIPICNICAAEASTR